MTFEEWKRKYVDSRDNADMGGIIGGVKNVLSGNINSFKKGISNISNENVRNIFANGKVFFATLGYASEVFLQKDKTGIAEDAVSAVIHKAVIYMPFAELVDIAKEKERLAKEEKRLNGEIKRCEGMLGNERFVSKAPEAKVQEEKDKLAKYQQMLEQVKEQIARIS